MKLPTLLTLISLIGLASCTKPQIVWTWGDMMNVACFATLFAVVLILGLLVFLEKLWKQIFKK
jgi:hypothetical protein